MAYNFRWNEWNRHKVAIHNVEPEEAEYVVNHARRPFPMRAGRDKFVVRGQAWRLLSPSGIPDPQRRHRLRDSCAAAKTKRDSTAAKAIPMSKKDVVDPILPGRYGRMSAAELDREVAMFDREFIIDEFKPLTPKMRAQLARAKRKGTKKSAAGHQRRVMLTIDKELLRRADEAAKHRGLTRSALFVQSLEAALRKTG
ncbi:MAG TPA: hypothetical protein VGM03_05950 [Phycisphaerae bacterium]